VAKISSLLGSAKHVLKNLDKVTEKEEGDFYKWIFYNKDLKFIIILYYK